MSPDLSPDELVEAALKAWRPPPRGDGSIRRRDGEDAFCAGYLAALSRVPPEQQATVAYDETAGCFYVRLREGQVANTVEVPTDLLIDVDAEGRTLGVEVLTITTEQEGHDAARPSVQQPSEGRPICPVCGEVVGMEAHERHPGLDEPTDEEVWTLLAGFADVGRRYQLGMDGADAESELAALVGEAKRLLAARAALCAARKAAE